MDGGEDDQGDERATSPKNVCWLYYLSVVVFWLLSLWSPTCWLWQRDDDEEDGGGNDRTRRQHCRRKYVGYTTCLLFVFLLLLSLWSPTCCMAMVEGQRRGGWWRRQWDERTKKVEGRGVERGVKRGGAQWRGLLPCGDVGPLPAGIHCTHGLNRMGFLIAAYLVEAEDWR